MTARWKNECVLCQKPGRRGNAHPSIVPYEVFKAADAYLTLGVANNGLWKQCCAALERPDLVTDGRFDTEAKRVEHRSMLVPLLNEIFGTRDVDDWLTVDVHGKGAAAEAWPGK